MVTPANQKKYVTPIAEEDIPDLLGQVCTGTELDLWQAGNLQQVVKLKITSKAEKAVWECATVNANENVSSMINHEVCLKWDSGETTYFGTGQLKQEGTNLLLSVSDKMAKSVQRNDFRVEASDQVPIEIDIKNKTFTGQDVSVSGTSFLAKTKDLDKFSEGKELDSFELFVRQVSFPIQKAKVVKIIEIDSERVKVCLKFSKINSQTEQKLYREINGIMRDVALAEAS